MGPGKKFRKDSENEYWTSEETLLFLRCRIQYDHMFTGSKGNAAQGWNKVIDEVGKQGLSRATRQKFKRKWTDEVSTFKKFLEPSKQGMSGVGVEDGEESALDSEVFDILYDHFAEKHVLHPPAILDSSLQTITKDPKVATGTSLYLGLEKEDADHDYCIPKDYIEEEVICDSPQKWVKSPLKVSPRAIKIVSACPGINVLKGKHELNCQEEEIVDYPCDAKPSSSGTQVVQVTTKSGKRCLDFYKDKKGQKAQKKSGEDDNWLKTYLENSDKTRKEEFGQLIDVLKQLVPK